ncbi:hypothetical protein AB1Y20_010932 [Prymnesium parvum]|uniref:Altered inheritance of mitochondria protein 24, mitochondrial n=1 Tax=Prymnesium parvum TaxID=97485 RepID=A0AB34IQV8_PRYPA
MAAAAPSSPAGEAASQLATQPPVAYGTPVGCPVRVESAVVPPGFGPGDTMAVFLPDGSRLEVDVPPHVHAGQTFQFQVPADDILVGTPAPHPATVAGQPVGAYGGAHVSPAGFVPAGAPPGGFVVSESYCGPRSWTLCCLLVLCNMAPFACCICCCPCDQRDLYVTAEGNKYTLDGTPVELRRRG